MSSHSLAVAIVAHKSRRFFLSATNDNPLEASPKHEHFHSPADLSQWYDLHWPGVALFDYLHRNSDQIAQAVDARSHSSL